MIDNQISDVLVSYGLHTVAPPARLAAGTLNENYLVQTQHGPRVLRRIRDDQPDENVRLEHETIAWVDQRALPVALPIVPTLRNETPDACLPSTCVRLASGRNGESIPGRWVLFDFARGETPPRARLSPLQAAALGDIHGRLHRTLADHPRSGSATFTMQWSAPQADSILERSYVAAQKAGASSMVLEGINLQRTLLSATNVRPPAYFARLPCQWLHGDFHNEQVLLDERCNVTAVVDWEKCQSGARVWELVRSIAFCGLLAHPSLDAYLRAYCRHVRLIENEVELGMELWWQSRIVGGWVWWAGYVEGSARVLDLVPDTIDTLNCLAQPGWKDGMSQRVVELVTLARLEE